MSAMATYQPRATSSRVIASPMPDYGMSAPAAKVTIDCDHLQVRTEAPVTMATFCSTAEPIIEVLLLDVLMNTNDKLAKRPSECESYHYQQESNSHRLVSLMLPWRRYQCKLTPHSTAAFFSWRFRLCFPELVTGCCLSTTTHLIITSSMVHCSLCPRRYRYNAHRGVWNNLRRPALCPGAGRK